MSGQNDERYFWMKNILRRAAPLEPRKRSESGSSLFTEIISSRFLWADTGLFFPEDLRMYSSTNIVHDELQPNSRLFSSTIDSYWFWMFYLVKMYRFKYRVPASPKQTLAKYAVWFHYPHDEKQIHYIYWGEKKKKKRWEGGWFLMGLYTVRWRRLARSTTPYIAGSLTLLLLIIYRSTFSRNLSKSQSLIPCIWIVALEIRRSELGFARSIWVSL